MVTRGGRRSFIPFLHLNVVHKENCHHMSWALISWSTGASFLCAPYPLPSLPAALGITGEFRSLEPGKPWWESWKCWKSFSSLQPPSTTCSSLGQGQSRTKCRDSCDSYSSNQTKRHWPAMRKAWSSCPVLFPVSISHTLSSFKGSSPCMRRTHRYFEGQNTSFTF